MASFVMGRLLTILASPDKTKDAGDDATVKAANRMSQTILRRDLTGEEKKWAGPVVHYAFGGSMGALYGAIAGSNANVGAGAAYGSALFLCAHETAVPALGLSVAPIRIPLRDHMNEWAAHVVYGVITGLTRWAVVRRVR